MAEKQNDIEAIYNAALKKRSEAERSAYLDAVCGDDAVLRARVESLVKAHEEAGDFLEVPAVGPDATVDESPSIEGPGTKIGRYELLELIGEGGMGLVYLAEQQEPLRRRVALKIVKLGMDTKQVIGRFEAERQALALLDHPNIAHVFDAGTTKAGRPYFVMEYVEGMSITKYCDEQKLNIEERLELFKQVCEGVQHAHQKGIIHRDIKPSNILVSNHGDKAVPKIIDFGIAKAITQSLTEETFFTHEGQLLGTPEYMSPEQVDLAAKDIDTRSDIYSLGVLLYVLLAGVLPFDRESLEHAGFAKLQRTIREDEPPLPSTRLTSLGDKAKVIAENRRTQIITLTRRLHRELEWIPMKAMRKERTRRYRSASELADDIQNYLTGTPLIAGPESTVYRARKFVRKHAGSVATAALVAVVIILGLVVSIVMGCRAEQAREKEATARTQVEQALARAENAERIAQEQRKLAEEQAEDYRRSLYFNRIALADISYRDGDIRRLHELLDSCPEDLRRWEWYRLNHISDQASMSLRGHSDKVVGVAVSPDGKRIVSASYDETVRVWDGSTGAELMTLRGHVGRVYSVSFSPDSKRIVSTSYDKTVKVWDAASGDELMTLRGHEARATHAGFSPDGTRIVSASFGKIKLWDAATGAELRTFRVTEDQGYSPIAFSPDGKRIVLGQNKTIKVLDTTTGDELVTLTLHMPFGWVESVAFSPDGKRIVLGSFDRTIKVLDAATGNELMSIQAHEGRVHPVAFSPDGSYIVSGGYDGTIKVWDAATGFEVMTLRGHEGGVEGVVFSPDCKRIVSCSSDKTLKVWYITVEHDRMYLSGHQNGVYSLAFSPDNKRIISGSFDKTIKLWDAATGAELMALRGHQDKVFGVGFSPDNKRIVSGSFDETIKLWDAATGAELMALSGHQDKVFGVGFSPDAKRIVSGSKDNTVKVWDVATGKELMTLLGHVGGVHSVSFSPDSKRIVSGGEGNVIKVWDAATGAELMTLRGHENWVSCVAFSPDGKRIVSASFDETIKLWDAGSGAELMTLRGHKSTVSSVVFSRDGKRIVSGSFDMTVKVWDVSTGTELMTLTGHTNRVVSVAFSPDGNTIAVGIADGNVILWESGPRPVVDGSEQSGESTQKVVD